MPSTPARATIAPDHDHELDDETGDEAQA